MIVIKIILVLSVLNIIGAALSKNWPAIFGWTTSAVLCAKIIELLITSS